MKKPKLGDKARDILTGFEGIVICKAKWLTGCDVYGLTPGLDKDGQPQKTHHFDEDRVEVVERNAVKLLRYGKDKKDKPRKTGGPSTLDSHPSRDMY